MKVEDRAPSRYDKGLLVVVLIIALAMGIASGIGKGWLAGVGSFAIMIGVWLLVPWVPWDRLELLQAKDKDERQRSLKLEAGAFAGVVMAMVALVGAMLDAAHGKDGDFATVAAVGGLSFLVACLVLPRMRR